MIRLKIGREAEWHDLGHGVEVLCEPMTTAVLLSARSDARFAALAADGGRAEPPDAMLVLFELNRAIASRLIVDWRGVEGEDGAAVTPTPEAVAALFDLHRSFFEAFNEKVLFAWQQVVQEKNGSSPLPSGTSAGAGGATARAAKEPVRRAPTSKMPRKAAKARLSGR
ncbi:MAG: hypothetical protein MUE98_00190 [Rhodobacteraceae bacterium]|jgi:hypothetical protein|nr:hypothetical protein [Paracoccaceae bacterium]